MSTLLSQLGVGGNPFNTAVGQRIEQATDASLASENWALNMEICDVINETDEGPKDAVRAIRKRLLQNAGKNYTVVMYTLTVLETCVKNCGKRFQLLATQKDFVQDLVKLIGPKNDPPTVVQEKVLSLIQTWAETFRSNSEMQGVVQVYTDLKQKGIEFPFLEETMAPIITPSRSVPVQPPVSHQVQEVFPREPPSSTIHPQQMDKLKKELEIVQGNIRVFGEMLNELVPGKEHQSDIELLQDLCKTCKHMQIRIVELIDKVGNAEITEELLVANDELNNLFVRYERFEKKRVAVSKPNAHEPQSENSTFESKPLIDLEEKVLPVSSQLQGLTLGADAQSGNLLGNNSSSAIDEFDMLAQSRNQITTETCEAAGDSDILQKTEFNREQDFHEVARWLDEKPDELATGANSDEFDRFLASRAAAAERLPNANPLSTPNNLEKERDDGKALTPLKSST